MKDWWKSKTFWVNFLTLAISIAGVFAASDWVKQYPEVVAIITGVVVPVLNIILRWVTDTAITSMFPAFDKLRPGIHKD